MFFSAIVSVTIDSFTAKIRLIFVIIDELDQGHLQLAAKREEGQNDQHLDGFLAGFPSVNIRKRFVSRVFAACGEEEDEQNDLEIFLFVPIFHNFSNYIHFFFKGVCRCFLAKHIGSSLKCYFLFSHKYSQINAICSPRQRKRRNRIYFTERLFPPAFLLLLTFDIL